MTRTVANVLATALDRTYHFPVFKPSRRDVRNLFEALEDLVLPMGSFPSEELQPWALTAPIYDSNPTAVPLSTTPSSGNTGSDHGGESPRTKPTLDDGGVKHLSIAPPTESTLRNVGPKSTVMRSSALPKRNDSGSAPSTESASIGRTPIGGQSNAASNSAVVISTPGDYAEVSIPEQTVVEANILGSGSIAVCEKRQKEQQDEDSTAMVKAVSTGTQTAEQQDGVSTATVKEGSTGTLALFESSIGKLVDREGTSGPGLQQLVQLVADIMKQRAEAKENISSETLRSKRAEEDLRDLWEVMAGVFERIISEQNKALQSSRNENHELTEENRKLKLEHSVDENKRKDTLDQHNDRLRTLEAEKESAEETAKTAKAAKAQLEDRINVVRDAKLAADDKHEDERKSLISSKIYARNERNEARRQLTDAVEEHQVAIKEKDQVIEGLEATLEEIRSTLTTSKELAASDKRHLEKQLEDQRQEKDREIGNLTDQLRESKAEAKSLSGWKDKAGAEKQDRKRLSKLLEDEKTRLREDKKKIVDQKNLDIRGLERTIKTNEADINRLKGMLTSLEAGEEMEGLKSGLEESKKQLQVSAKNMQDVKQQLQNCQHEIKDLKSTIKARDKTISEEAEKTSKAKEDLKQLEQTTRVSKQGLEEKVQELGEQKDDLVRKLEVAQNAEQTVRADIKRLHNENGQTVAGYERTIMERDEEIHRLQLNEQNYENHSKTAVEDAVGEVIEKAKGEIGELERDKKAIEQAAKEAVETLQKQLDEERRSTREAKEKATKTENELRNEMDILKSQVNNVEKSHSTDPAGPEAGKDAQIVGELVTQANDANTLLLEIGENGLAKKSVEQTVLRQLNDAKIALHRVKGVLLEPPARYHRGRLVKILDGVHVNEERIAQLPIDSALVSQAKMANARLLRLEKILEANADVQRDAMLEALHTATPFERKIMKPRALRRPAKASPPFNPSTAGQTDVSMGQSQQTNGGPEQQYNPPIFNLQQSAQTTGGPEKQYNPPIFNLQQSAQPHIQAATPQIQIQDFGQTQPGGPTNGHGFQPDAKVAFDFTSIGGAPASSDNPLFQPFAMVDTGTGGPSTPKNNNQNGLSTKKPMVVNRDHRLPFMDLLNSLKPAADNMASGAMPVADAPSPIPGLQADRQAPESIRKPKSRRENQIPQMPKGWTDEMTGTVRDMRGEDYLFISEMVKELHGLQVKDPEGLEKWINKLQADHEAEMNPNLDPPNA